MEVDIPGGRVLIDEEDAPLLRLHNWRVRSARGRSHVVYQYRDRGVQKLRWLGRLILGAVDGQLVRYRDGDPLNLQRANLTLETPFYLSAAQVEFCRQMAEKAGSNLSAYVRKQIDAAMKRRRQS